MCIMQFPHCDPNILHSPKWGCKYCNAHPDWQALRETWGINFTGEHDPKKLPCPSLRFRGEDRVHGEGAWHGNVPRGEDGNVVHPTPEFPRPTIFDRLKTNPFKDE